MQSKFACLSVDVIGNSGHGTEKKNQGREQEGIYVPIGVVHSLNRYILDTNHVPDFLLGFGIVKVLALMGFIFY